jgi:hypothetical protein
MAYNIGWMKVDPLWEVIIRLGLMPFASRIFNRVLRLGTKEAIAGRQRANVVSEVGSFSTVKAQP